MVGEGWGWQRQPAKEGGGGMGRRAPEEGQAAGGACSWMAAVLEVKAGRREWRPRVRPRPPASTIVKVMCPGRSCPRPLPARRARRAGEVLPNVSSRVGRNMFREITWFVARYRRSHVRGMRYVSRRRSASDATGA